MIRMKIEMTHLNDNAAQVFGNSFTHGTRYFKGHCIVWLFASCMDGGGAIMSNVCDTAIQFRPRSLAQCVHIRWW